MTAWSRVSQWTVTFQGINFYLEPLCVGLFVKQFNLYPHELRRVNGKTCWTASGAMRAAGGAAPEPSGSRILDYSLGPAIKQTPFQCSCWVPLLIQVSDLHEVIYLVQPGSGVYPELWPERQGCHRNVNIEVPHLFVSQVFLKKGPTKHCWFLELVCTRIRRGDEPPGRARNLGLGGEVG